MEAASSKRKLDADMPVPGSKRLKSYEKGGRFEENNCPEGMFHIGDCTYVYAKVFRGKTIVHIRRYQQYGKMFYPTKEGITLQPEWIPIILRRCEIPENITQLELMNERLPSELKVESKDFNVFTFNRIQKGKGDIVYQKSMNISYRQWFEMRILFDKIYSSVVEESYAAMDLSSVSEFFEYNCQNLDNNLPTSLDVKLGTETCIEIFKECLKELILEQGLKTPEVRAEELWGNTVQSVNEAASCISLPRLAEVFAEKVDVFKDHLCLARPAMYITKDFLKSVQMQSLLKEVRLLLAPPDTFEYFQDYSSEFLSVF